MDKELMNQQPEEEIEAEQTVTETEETVTEEIEEVELCPICESGKVAEGKYYCENCEAQMLKRKPPFLAWICGAAAIVLSFFALIAVFLVSAPAIQVIKGDIAAEENKWYSAYIEYNEVDTVLNEINSILGTSKLTEFIKVGSDVRVKLIEAYGKSTNPVNAYSLARQYFTDDEIEKNSSLREYKYMNDSYNTAYESVSEALDFMMQEGSTYEASIAKLEEFRGKEGIDDIFIDYFSAAASSYFNLPVKDQIASFEKIDKTAKESNKDYRWLYYIDYAKILIEAGMNDKANELFDEMIAENKNADDYYSLKINSLLSAGDIEGAEKVLDDFKVDNESYDSTYIFEISILRSKGELDKALELCKEALEVYGTTPELYRQRALIYLVQGKYDEAYEEVFAANSTAYNLYYYYNDSSAFTVELDHTVYVCAYLCDKFGEKSTENAVYISEILTQYAGVEFSDKVTAIINGEKTVQEVLSEGACDLV